MYVEKHVTQFMNVLCTYILPCPVYLILFMRDMCEETENKAIHLLLPQNRNAISPLLTCPLN